MSILRKQMFNLHEGVIAAAQTIEEVNAKDIWDEPDYKAKTRIT